MNPYRKAITRRRVISPWRVRLFALVLCPLWLSPASGAQSKAAANKPKPEPPAAAVSESEPALATIPRSEFKLPTSPAEGRDPFFPASARVYGEAKVTPSVTATTKPPPVLEFVLNSFSSGENPLVTINNVNFGVGDNLEVVSGKERVRVVCLEINVLARTAVIEANGVRHTLRFTQSN